MQILKKMVSNRRRLIFIVSIAVVAVPLLWLVTHLDWSLLLAGRPEPAPPPPPVVAYDEFQMPVDSFTKEIVKIRSDQYLSDILVARGISMAVIDRIAKEFKRIFDVRDMREGNPLHFYYSADSTRSLDYMIYKKNPADYVVYKFKDTLDVCMRHKEVVTSVCFLEATIKSSIWDAIVDQGIHIGMVAEISSVFQWMIDPSSLNKGDRFEVIYENETIDGESIGIGKVLSARFLYGKKWFEAYVFTQNGVESYFNEKGESLKRAFLKWPFNSENFRITSRFTGSRMHPILRIRRPHYGVDYATASGTPVVTIGDGKVIFKGWDRGGGNTVKIKHNNQFTTSYMHLKGFGPGINSGASVRQGDVIGYVGSTGLSTGPHLDFRVYENGKPVDPLSIESPPVEPVDPKLRPQYDSIVKMYKAEYERYKNGTPLAQAPAATAAASGTLQ